MLKKVVYRETYFKDIHELFGFDEHEELEERRARLFPIGNSDSETSTTSIFLATMSAVKEYRELLLSTIGINKIKNKNVQLHTYTELSNKNGDRPDGLIVLTSGKNNPIVEWMCFVEVKVKNNILENEQIERYIDFAKDIGIDSIITISNQYTTTPLYSPISTKKRNFNLYHWSWTYLKVMASRLIKTDAIEDEDHAYILSEFRRYCDTHKNLSNFVNMGKEWKDNIAKVHSLSPTDKIDEATLNSIIDVYLQEEKDIALQLTDNSNYMVEMVFKKDRRDDIAKSLNESKKITTEYMIDGDKNKTFFIEADFMKHSIKCHTHVCIDKGKAQAQTSALLKRMEKAGTTDSIMITAYYPRKKHVEKQISLQMLIDEKQREEQYSTVDKSLGDEIKVFEISTFDPIGKNFGSSKLFISTIENLSSRFLSQVMDNVR